MVPQEVQKVKKWTENGFKNTKSHFFQCMKALKHLNLATCFFFVCLDSISVHFLTFWNDYGTINPYFQWKYKFSTVPHTYLRVINHLARFKCFSAFIYSKKVRFCVFDPIFSPFFDLLDLLWDHKPLISVEI